MDLPPRSPSSRTSAPPRLDSMRSRSSHRRGGYLASSSGGGVMNEMEALIAFTEMMGRWPARPSLHDCRTALLRAAGAKHAVPLSSGARRFMQLSGPRCSPLVRGTALAVLGKLCAPQQRNVHDFITADASGNRLHPSLDPPPRQTKAALVRTCTSMAARRESHCRTASGTMQQSG